MVLNLDPDITKYGLKINDTKSSKVILNGYKTIILKRLSQRVIFP
jgi:hypothetical protein